jgi:hypothetical protein
MTRRRLLLLSAHVLAACAVWLLAAPAARATGDGLPSFLADDEYWRIVTGFSERPGTFPSDNLLSNERLLQEVIPDLARIAKPNEVFLGVGPEQNFTYIAALKPRMAFIVDIRRGNLDLHLMYKALFELSADRAEFVSRLFSKSRPIGLSSTSSVSEIFDAYVAVDSSDSLYVENLRAIVAHLTKTHGFSLSADDMLRLQRTHRAFYIYGPNIQYSSTRSGGRRDEPTYRDLMLATDSAGQQRSFLASEEAFAFVKDLETSNLVVPLIGNFTGPKAIRAIAEYLAGKRSTVAAFYVSNVEEYLRREGTWNSFCANVARLPLDESSTFIRSVRETTPGAGFRLLSELGVVASEVRACDPKPE